MNGITALGTGFGIGLIIFIIEGFNDIRNFSIKDYIFVKKKED